MKINTLNKEYTLDNFIFGDCNELALDTAKLVVENTEKCYNPLLIYGKNGSSPQKKEGVPTFTSIRPFLVRILFSIISESVTIQSCQKTRKDKK